MASDVAPLALPESVTFGNVRAALDDALAALASGATEFALGRCASFDSSLVALLLALRRAAGERAQACRFTDVPMNLHKLASLYGVDELLFEAPAG